MNEPFSKPEPNPTSAAAAPSITLDCHHILTRAGGDPEMLVRLCGIFLDELPMHLRSMQSAIIGRDYAYAERTLERLRNCLLIFGSSQLSHQAEALEQAVRAHSYHQVRSQWKRLRTQLQLLVPQVQLLMLEMAVIDGAVQ